MTTKTQNLVTKTVKWDIFEDRTIKFVEDENPCKLSEEVAKQLEHTPVIYNDKVKVEVENNVVVYLHKENSESKQEIKGDTKVADDTKVYTVKGINFKKTGGILFDETGEGVWFTPGKGVLDFIEKAGIKKGDKVEVVTSKNTGKGNDWVNRISRVVAKTETKAKNDYAPPNSGSTATNTEVKSQTTQKSYANSTQDSIEAQSALNNAYSVVASMVQGLAPEVVVKNVDLLKKLVTTLADHTHSEVQRLKKSV